MGLITDPSTGLLDGVDYILLAGSTGLHERFGRLYTLVNGNLDKDNLKINSDFPWTGNHTFEGGKLKVKGAGAGIASIQNANTANNRLITIPDPGADADFVTTKGNQTIDDTKTFSQNLTFKSGTGFNGVFDHANTADRTWVAPDASGNVLISAAQQTIDGRKTFSGADTLLLPTDAPTVNRSAGLVSNVLQIHDGTSAKRYLRTDTYVEAGTAVGATIDLGVINDLGFVDVGSGTQITFTVNVPGKYLIIFNFTPEVLSNTSINSQTIFQLTDGVTNKGQYEFAVVSSPNNFNLATSVTINEIFDYTTTGSKTIKLQKFNFSSTNLVRRQLLTGAAFSAVNMRAFRVAD